jgi:hypothetical protein
MSRMYGILAVTGWVWTVAVAIFLWLKLPRKGEAAGFEVEKSDEQH